MNDALLQQYVDQVFAIYDRDRSGSLDVRELAGFFNDIFAKMGDPRRLNQQQATAALQAIDRNNDGRANKMELFTALKRILTTSQTPYQGGGNNIGGGYGGNNMGGGYGGQNMGGGYGGNQGWK